MVDMKNNDIDDVEVEVTSEEQPEILEPELIDLEEGSDKKNKKLKEKLVLCEEEKKKILDDFQRSRADFLNAKKRLENERAKDKVRFKKEHVMELLPLCDSFQMAMLNTEAWEKADKSWRTGVEGIYNQLMQLLEQYQVKAFDPKGEHFNPHRHEAVGMETVEDEALNDAVISVIQRGYEMKDGDTIEILRPARVTTGVIKK
jgi:molecular chaperone GrpE